MDPKQPYPIRIKGELDANVSRWLWLVKWLLAIPHYFLLAFLWLALFVLTFVAFFAILIIGGYPRVMFDFNVGVLRWAWRVAFYSYGALGTDRYPPFTLDDVPDYPARLEVAYPERLSRGLVLVKSWLLAIPHLVIVGIFLGGGSFATAHVHEGDWDAGFHISLIGALVFFAGVALLFTTRYPRGIFDFVLGLDRWVARVAAYVLLMRDEYPPFGDGPYPAAIDIVDPVGPRDRVTVFFRLILAIPHFIVLVFVLFAWCITTIIAWFAIVFTGTYPQGLYEFGVGSLRWLCRVQAYLLLLVDEYPPFSLV